MAEEKKYDDDFPAFEIEDDGPEELDPKDLPVTLKDHLWRLTQKQQLTDVQFTVGDGKRKAVFKAHRLVLACASPLFEAMLFPFDDGKEEDAVLEITLPSQDPDAFEALLRCVYTDSVDVDPSNLQSLIAVATKYQVEKMRLACADFMEHDIKIDNICDLFEIAPSLLGKPDFGFPFIRENTEEVLKSEGFLKLSKYRVKALLEDDMLAGDEHELFNSLLRWGDAQVEKTGKTRKEVLADVLPAIRFPCMPVNKVAGLVAQSGLLAPEQLLKVFQYVSLNDEKRKEGMEVPFSTKPRSGKKNYLVVWDPTQSFTNGLYTVTNKGHTARKATSDSTIYILRATQLLEAKGKYYWEIHIDNLVPTNDIQIGAAQSSYSWTSAWLQGAGSYWIDRSGQAYEGSSARFRTGALATGDRFGFNLDYKKNILEFYRGRGVKGGKMERIGTFTGITMPLYPVLAARPVGNQFTSV